MRVCLKQVTSAPLDVLHPVEQEIAHTRCLAPSSSMHEFIAGRLAAKAALAYAGLTNLPVLATDEGKPFLLTGPDGLEVSITHTRWLAAAVVDFSPISIDLETTDRITEDIWPILFSEAEIRWLQTNCSNIAPTLMFSIKECVQKLLSRSQVHDSFDLHDIYVLLNDDLSLGTLFVLGSRWQDARLCFRRIPSGTLPKEHLLTVVCIKNDEKT